MPPSVSNSKTIKSKNLTLIFNLIRSAPISRADISKKTKMAKSTTSTIINKLIAEGRVCEIGTYDTTSGRKPVLLDIVKDYCYAFGILITRNHIRTCITDLKSNLLCKEEKRIKNEKNPDKLIDWACDSLFKMAFKNNIPKEKIIGVGVSAPGPIDYINGKILNPPNLNFFHNYNISEEIFNRTSLITKLEKDSILLARKEAAHNNLSDFMFLLINEGLGSSFTINNKIFRGCLATDSELGHTSVDLNGEQCFCGNRGCIEHYVKLSNLKERFNFSEYSQVVDAAYTGDKKAIEVIDFIAKNLSVAIVNAINLFGIQKIIIYGDYSYRSDLLLYKIIELVNSLSFIAKSHKISISFSSLTENDSLISSTFSIIEEYFNQKIQLTTT